jgi:hypothetical protein
MLLAQAAEETGRLGEALDDYVSALKALPQSPRSWTKLPLDDSDAVACLKILIASESACGANRWRKLVTSPVSVEESVHDMLFVPAGLLVIHFFSFFRPTSCSCNLRGWLTAEESHQPFQVLRRGCQVELLAHEAHPAQPQSA